MAAFPELGLLRSQDGFPKAGRPSFPGMFLPSPGEGVFSPCFPLGIRREQGPSGPCKKCLRCIPEQVHP